MEVPSACSSAATRRAHRRLLHDCSQGAPCLHFCAFHGIALQYLPLTPVPLFPGPVPRLSPLGPPLPDVDAFYPGLGAGPGRRSCVVVVLPALPHGPAWRPCLVNRNSVFHYEIHIWQKYEQSTRSIEKVSPLPARTLSPSVG